MEKKRPDLALNPIPGAHGADELDRVTIGNRVMREIVMLHRASRTVIAVDLVESGAKDAVREALALRVGW